MMGSSAWSFSSPLPLDQWQISYGDSLQEPSVLVKAPLLLFQQHGQPTHVSYSTIFEKSDALYEQMAIYIPSIRHADEVWVNGVKIGGTGTLSLPWAFFDANPQSLPRLYRIPKKLIIKGQNTLLVKTNVGFATAWGAMFPGGAGIQGGVVWLGEYEYLAEKFHSQKLTTVAMDSLFMTLSLVSLLIIGGVLIVSLGYRSEFKWLIINSLLLFLGALSNDLAYLLGLVSTDGFMIVAMLLLPYTTALYFWSQWPVWRVQVVRGIGFLWAVCIVVILMPEIGEVYKVSAWYLWSLIAVLCFGYSLVGAFKNVYLNRVGGVAQLLAVLVYIVSIRTQWLPEGLFGHRNIQIGSLFYRYALLFAYFQQLAQLRVDYKHLAKRLVTVTDDILHGLARDLHDGMGQHLASAKLHLQLSQLKSNDPSIIASQQEVTDSIYELRQLVNGLDPIAVEGVSLGEMLRMEAEKIKNTYSVKLTVTIKDGITVNPEEKIGVYRIFQECVGNALKHAEAEHVQVNIDAKRQFLVMTIEDDGIGFVPSEASRSLDSGYGMVSVKERLALLGGHCDIVSRPKQGTQIMIQFPLSAKLSD